MTLSPTVKPQRLIATVLLACLAASTQKAAAVDDIDQPAGDLGESYDDDTDPAMVDIPADGTAPGGTEAKTDAPVDQEAEADADQIGPVWESYNSNMKSVAQEVTKGLRVEDVVEPPTEYHYAAFGKPDPFVPPMVTARDEDVATVSSLEVPIVSPLQAHELSALSVVGIWQLSSGERKALVMAPPANQGSAGRSQGIIVRNGDPIGKNGGKILAIGETFITVREFRLAIDGTRQYEDVTMQMGARDTGASGKIRFVPGSEKTEIVPESDRSIVTPSGSAAPSVPVRQPAAAGLMPQAARLTPTPQMNAVTPAGAPGGQPAANLMPAGQAASPAGASVPVGTPATKATPTAVPPAAVPPAAKTPAG